MTASRFLQWGAPLALALLFAPTLAHADPVTATIVTAIVGTGASATVVGIATFVVNSVLYAAASLAIPFSRRSLNGKGRGQ